LKVKPSNVPPMLIIPVKSYVETDVEVNGHVYKRRRIDVIMYFSSPKGCDTVSRTLKPGFVQSQFKTHIYAGNAERMCYFFGLKYELTAQKWRGRNYSTPALRVVEHNCPMKPSKQSYSHETLVRVLLSYTSYSESYQREQ
jgi:hypothetical protein